MTAAGVSMLVALLADGHLANLEKLNLQTNKLSDAGAQALAAALSAGQLPKLKQLQVDGNAIGDAGAEALAAAVCGGWRSAPRCATTPSSRTTARAASTRAWASPPRRR